MAHQMSDKTPPKLIKLYKDMSDLTHPECRLVCRSPYNCCSAEYCEFTIDFARKRGVELGITGHSRLPLMGPGGCTAPPHLRPMCTVHTCEIGASGYKKDDPDGKWNKKYYDLRSAIEEIEMKLIDGQQIR